MKIRARKPKRLKRFEIGFCSNLDSIWEGLGEGSGASWALLGRSWDACWPLLERLGALVGALGRSWAPEFDFAGIVEGFEQGLEEVLGGIWEAFGRVWDRVWLSFLIFAHFYAF